MPGSVAFLQKLNFESLCLTGLSFRFNLNLK